MSRIELGKHGEVETVERLHGHGKGIGMVAARLCCFETCDGGLRARRLETAYRPRAYTAEVKITYW
jgi:hypothetical protein